MQWVVALLALGMDIPQEGAWQNKNGAIDAPSIFACPRCRRAQPPGPRKRPHPGGMKKVRPQEGGQK